MTNFEKFGKEIIVDLIKERGYDIGGINKKNGKLMCCGNDDIEACEECVFNGECGSEENIRNWLDAEYQAVDWSKVPIDTKVLVRYDNEIWCKRHFAYYRDKRIWVFNNGLTSWTVNDLSEVSGWKYGKLLEDGE